MTQEATSSRRKTLLLVIPLLMAVSLTAMDTSIVNTALPTIVGSLGGLRLFSWVFSVYLLTSTMTVPIYGKLADLYGRKRILLFGISLFLFGSALCGLAQSMEMLIVCRAIQGLGAGGVLPITQTIVGDTFSIEQRAKIQGFFSGVWGVTAIAGPLLGGIITDSLSWRWVFYVNLPVGIACLFLITIHYVERTEKRAAILDYWGAALLAGSVVSFLLVLLQFGPQSGWASGQTFAALGLSALLLAVFIYQEQRAPEPVIALSLFKSRVIVVSYLAIFLAGGLSFGVSAYVPLFKQGVFGGSATEAGLVIAPMSVSWILGSIVSGRVIIRFGFFPASLAGGIFLFVGSGLLLLQSDANTILIAAMAGLIMGIGMGLITNSTVIAVQNSVEWGQRGVATATSQFFRTIGGSISVAIMGSLLNSRMEGRLEGIDGIPEGRKAELLLRASTRDQLPAEVLQAMQHALAATLHEVFLVVFAASCLCLAVVNFVPRGRLSAVLPPTSRRPVVRETADAETAG